MASVISKRIPGKKSLKAVLEEISKSILHRFFEKKKIFTYEFFCFEKRKYCETHKGNIFFTY